MPEEPNQEAIPTTGAVVASAAVNTPKVVLNGFFPKAIKVGDLNLFPLSAARVMILQKLNSPYLKMQPDGKYADVTDIDVARAAFVFAMPLKEIRTAMGRGDLQFDDAVWGFMDRVPVSDLPTLGKKIQEAISQGLSTILSGEGGRGPLAGPQGEALG